MASQSTLFSCGHRCINIPTPPSSSPSTPSVRTTLPTKPHPCHQCSRLAAEQQQETIEQRHLQLRINLLRSINEAREAATTAKENEMREFFKDGRGWEDRHRVTAAEIEMQLGERERKRGELEDLKRKEREEIREAWRGHEKLWPTSRILPQLRPEIWMVKRIEDLTRQREDLVRQREEDLKRQREEDLNIIS